MAITQTLSQLLFMCALVIAGLALRRATRLDLTLACLLAGVAGGLVVPILGFDTGIRASNIHDLVFYLVLPLLIFEAAWHIQPGLLRRWLGPVLTLATVGVLIACATLAIIAYYAMAHPGGFPWLAALLLGAMLAATDPVSVVASLRSAGASHDLATLVEGESLFNDATAVVLFGVVLSIATGAALPESGVAAFFTLSFLGGLVVGALLGLGAALLARVLADPAASNIILITLALLSFYLAEHLLHVSGILSVMAAAMTTRALLYREQDGFLRSMESTWDWIGLLFNGLIFALMGLVITFDMFTEQWLAMLIAIAAATVARAVAVVSCAALCRGLPTPIPTGWQIILCWGGLRGAIAIVLVLSLPLSLPYWWTLQSMVFGVVLFNLLIQGTTVSTVIRRYG